MLAIIFVQPLLGLLYLQLRSNASLWSLRVAEVLFFATQAAVFAFIRFDLLTSIRGTPELDVTLVGNYGSISLFNFISLILAYGVLIPNSRRRSVIGVFLLTAVPFAVTPAAVAVSPALREHLLPLTIQAAACLIFPAAIAAFAAARATALQRRAYEAERLARGVGQNALTRRLGAGGMGEVYLAEHRFLKRPCAVKFIRAELAAQPTVAERFLREAQSATGLTHFNTVRVYDYGQSDDGAFYYVMEYLDGPTLERLVREHGPLPPARAIYLLRQLCGALAEAHEAGLVHRDLKPSNVIVTKLGGAHDVAKLLDFGLALDASPTGDSDRLTRQGEILGTPAYMSPEQALAESSDARSDIYGLGAVAHFMLTARPPFEGKSLREILKAQLQDVPPELDRLPADLAAVVGRCLRSDARERYPSAVDLDRALSDCADAGEWSAGKAAGWWRSVQPSIVSVG